MKHIYTCPCGYTNSNKTHMNRHTNSISCQYTSDDIGRGTSCANTRSAPQDEVGSCNSTPPSGQKEGGYFYIIVPSHSTYIKMGYSTGSRRKIEIRYKTYYGSATEYIFFQTPHPSYVEKRIFEEFESFRIEGELFIKTNLHRYIESAVSMCPKHILLRDKE